MKSEIEAKFLDVKPKELRKNLRKLGARLVHRQVLMKRYTIDFPDDRLQKIGGWIRVRDEGNQVTLSYKKLNSRTLHGTKELTVVVSDFEKTKDIFLAVGLQAKAFQETKREKWLLGSCEITIDKWPWIPTFVEIEASSAKIVKATAEKLGFKWPKALFGSVENAYQKYFDFTEEEIDHWPRITFTPPPRWLKAKKKK